MDDFTDEELKHFITAYIIEDNDNPHERFSELLGVERGTIKKLYYKILFSNRVTEELICNVNEYYGGEL